MMDEWTAQGVAVAIKSSFSWTADSPRQPPDARLGGLRKTVYALVFVQPHQVQAFSCVKLGATLMMNQIQQKLALTLVILGAAAYLGAAQQQTDSSKAPVLPPTTPMFSPAELSAKVPAPKPADVSSSDAIIHAAYDVISGPAGARDWNRFRSLFLPQARFTEVGKAPDGATFIASWNVEEFVRDAGEIFRKDPFYETGIVNVPSGFGGMRQVLSSYESRRAPEEKPFQRGVNSFQVLNDGKRWWIVSIFWDSERPGNPVPARLAGK